MPNHDESPVRDIKFLPRLVPLALWIFSKIKFRKFTVVGDLPDFDRRGLIVVCNHPSNAATALLIGTLFIKAKRIDDVKLRKYRYPRALADGRLFTGIRGAIFRFTGQIPVDRSRGADAFKTAEQVLKEGGLIMIYPEGTRTKKVNGWPIPVPSNRKIEVKNESPADEKFYGTGHYKTGAVRLAIATGATIVPTLQYLDRAGRGAEATIQFDEPISFADLKGKELSNEELQSQTGQIMYQIAEMMAAAKGKPMPDGVRDQILAG
ncbi:1-acyl-sn-glycerol-3-phosphate acyltransferase [Candidatus Saccharibacteria bacterium]|nr:1-acyl-sn-glycerol-3-phosphate acyltransferase [Candidatus Saccharibacteria bacterium]